MEKAYVQGTGLQSQMFWYKGLVGGRGPGAQALFVWTPQRPDREQMWKGRRLGSRPEQLGEIKNNSIPGDWNYSGREGGRQQETEAYVVTDESLSGVWKIE